MYSVLAVCLCVVKSCKQYISRTYFIAGHFLHTALEMIQDGRFSVILVSLLNLHATTTLENVYLVLESIVYRIAYQMRWWRLELLTVLRTDSINTGLIKRFFLTLTLT